MLQEEINRGNKIIAEFLGGEVKVCFSIKDKDYYAWYGASAIHYRKEIMKINVGEVIALEQLYFHSNWLWLAPVIEELEELGIAVNSFRHTCTLIDMDGNLVKSGTPLFEEEADTKILAVWKAIVHFITTNINLKK